MDTSEQPSASQDQKKLMKQEIATYVQTPHLGREQSAVDWWRSKTGVFPKLAFLARRYLSLPASSIESERLFSTCGAVADSRRSSLLPENVAMIIFLNKNL